MLTAALTNKNIPQLSLQDTVSKSLQLIWDYKLTHLPVVSEMKFIGLISEEDLLDAEDNKLSIEHLMKGLIKEAIRDNIHFLHAVNHAVQFETNIIPVVGENDIYIGAISANSLLKALGHFIGSHEQAGLVVLQMENHQYSTSEICRIAEENDYRILHLNTTMEPASGLLTVTLHLNKKAIGPLISTFERYDYNVTYYLGQEEITQEINSNYRHLMNYLDL